MTEALDWDDAHANATTPKAAYAAALERVRGGLLALRAGVLADTRKIRRQRLANGLVNRYGVGIDGGQDVSRTTVSTRSPFT